jgi:hypothetical protein
MVLRLYNFCLFYILSKAKFLDTLRTDVLRFSSNILRHISSTVLVWYWYRQNC